MARKESQIMMASAEPAGGTVTFVYNTDGQRFAKQTTDGSVTGYLYDYKKLLHETDGEYVHQYDAERKTGQGSKRPYPPS